MITNNKPLVTVFTPVYNADKYIAECIESVINQTYENWEYIIVDNCSTDNTADIINKYASMDARIQLSSNKVFLPQIPNWNHGLRQVNAHSAYCKIVHADDWIYPACLEKMVEVGEQSPRVGIIGAYRIEENTVDLDGLPPKQHVFFGRDICKLYLLNKLNVFGSPSSLLFRTEIIKRKDPFYDEREIHTDTDVCLQVLSNWDFGFVHQVLTYTRRHNESTSSFVNRFDTRIIERMKTLEKYGPQYLEPDELAKRRKKLRNEYHRFLAKRLFEGKDLSYWKYHKKELQEAGIPISWLKLLISLGCQAARPEDTYPHIKKGFSKIFPQASQAQKRGKALDENNEQRIIVDKH